MGDHLIMTVETLAAKASRCMKKSNKTLKRSKVRMFVIEILSSCCGKEDLPYHNMYHTYEVFKFATELLKYFKNFTPQQRTLVQVAALCHDYGHFGVSNRDWLEDSHHSFMSGISLESWASLLSITESYNEVMHVDCAMNVIKVYKRYLFPQLHLNDVESYITGIIMSTDLKYHDSYCDRLVSARGTLDDMIWIIKTSDLSHFFSDFRTHCYWVYRIHREMNGEVIPSAQYLADDTIFFCDRYVFPMVQLAKDDACHRDLRDRLERNMGIWRLHMDNLR